MPPRARLRPGDGGMPEQDDVAVVLGPVRPRRHGIEREIFVWAVGMSPVRRQQSLTGDDKKTPLAGPLVVRSAKQARRPACEDAFPGADEAPQLFVALPLHARPSVHAMGVSHRQANKNDLARLRVRDRFDPGPDLFSQGPTSRVSSALTGLTAVFGMGTGVTPSLQGPRRSVYRAGTAAATRIAGPPRQRRKEKGAPLREPLSQRGSNDVVLKREDTRVSRFAPLWCAGPTARLGDELGQALDR